MSEPTDAKTTAINKPTLWAEIRNLISLATPIIVASTAATLIGVVDTIMIAPLGTTALAAASITTAALVIFYAAIYGLVSVCGVLIGQAFGAGDDTAVTAAVKASIVVSLTAGLVAVGGMLAIRPLMPLLGQPADVVVAAAPYWAAMSFVLIPFAVFYAIKGLYDATDRAWLGVAFAFVAVVLNIPANWLLIHGVGNWQGFGLLGAGLASLLSETVSLLLAVLYWRFARAMVSYRKPVALKWADVKLQFREGMPLALGYAGEGGAFSVAALMLGLFGAGALAASQIVVSVTSVSYMVPLGMAAAVAIRIGQAIGADGRHRLRTIGLAAQVVVIVWMTIVMVLLLAFGDDIANALADTPEVAALAATMFLFFAAMQIVDGVQATSLGALRGLLDNTWPMMVTLASYWLFALPLAYVVAIPLSVGPNGVWIGYGAGLLLAAILLTWRFLSRTRDTA